jgi:hypothetical protein
MFSSIYSCFSKIFKEFHSLQKNQYYNEYQLLGVLFILKKIKKVLIFYLFRGFFIEAKK